MNDHGRSAVYAAELMAFEGTELEVVESFDAVAAFAAALVAESWWPGGAVEVRPSRRDARSSVARQSVSGRWSEIRLASPQCTRATVVHELAHVLAGAETGHGARFRRAHVDIACVAFGSERASWLADAYLGAGLDLGDRVWPEPPVAGRAIAL